MKIKCKKCGKHFDPDMYSGLCPKCGTYNGAHMADTDVSRYLSSQVSGEEAHRLLHERYGDEGHNENAHRSLHETYDAGYEAAHPEHGGQKSRKAFDPAENQTRTKKKAPGLTVILAVLLGLFPLLSMGFYALWEQQAVLQYLNSPLVQVPLIEEDTLIFQDVLLEAPVQVKVLGMDYIERAEHTREGKMLAAVKVQAGSSAYSFDARVNRVALQYESGGAVCYQQPLDAYYLEVYLYGLGLTEEDLLHTYGIGNGEMQEGYFFFCIPVDAQNPALSVMAGEGSGNQKAFMEGTIPLSNVGSAGLADREEAK